MSSAKELADRCGNSKRSGNGYMCRCPCHDDKKGSLWVIDNDDGTIGTHCHAGCDPKQVREYLGLTKMHNTNGHHSDIAYDYTDATGKLLFQKIRKPDKNFFLRRPLPSGEWAPNLQGIDEKPLYNLPAVLEAIKNDQFIAILEGEKDCKNFEKFTGMPATCNFEGANKQGQKPKWKDEYSRQLYGAKVALLYDNDEAGVAHRDAIIQSLRPYVKSITIVHIPNEFKDFSDWLNAGGSKETFRLLRQEKVTTGVLDVPSLPASAEPTPTVPPDSQMPYVKTKISDFLARKYPPREHIIGPFVRQGLNMVFAPAGVGKTYFSMSLAFAIATGGRFLNWQCEIKQSVIYFDGELPAFLLQDRLNALIKNNGLENADDIDFSLVTPDEQSSGMPDFSSIDGQNAALKLIGDAQFIVIDNISTLCRTGDENDAQDWIPVQNWLLKLRTMGKSVLLVHHAGKGFDGDQRGTSKRSDVLDLVVRLKHPSNHMAKDGCSFEMTFPKSRHFRNQNDTKALAASYSNNGWEIQGLEETMIEKVRYLKTIRMKQKDMAVELGISAGQVSKLIARIEKEDKETGVNSPW